jgi:ABC-type nitrate/sulfonate/bicarbonate transport system permease component
MTVHRTRVKIYQSRLHLALTFFIIVAPLLFLGIFAGVTHLAGRTLFFELGRSVLRLFIAYAISVILGWACAVSFYRGKLAPVALPVFDVLQSFPTFAALPLATYLWGRSDATVIIFLVITVIWPIFFSIISSLRLMKHDWEESADIVGLKGTDYVRWFLLPVSIPGLITGSIIGLGEGWEALVATEIIVNVRDGLGNFFRTYSQNLTITVFGIFGLLLLIFSINKLIWIPLLEWSHQLMEE